MFVKITRKPEITIFIECRFQAPSQLFNSHKVSAAVEIYVQYFNPQVPSCNFDVSAKKNPCWHFFTRNFMVADKKVVKMPNSVNGMIFGLGNWLSSLRKKNGSLAKKEEQRCT